MIHCGDCGNRPQFADPVPEDTILRNICPFYQDNASCWIPMFKPVKPGPLGPPLKAWKMVEVGR